MKLRIGRVMASALSALCVTMVCSGQGADESAAVKTAKAVVENHKDAVVEVRLVLKTKMSFGGREGQANEQTHEINGTVIDPSGLTVISNFATDPSGAFSLNEGEDNPQFKEDTVITGTKIVLADGKEYPAKVVLRDKDLDLAFVRPEEGGLHLPYIEIKAPPAEPQMLDEVILLTRLDRSADRVPIVKVVRLMGIIRKPRTQYVAMALNDLGCPVFDRQGNPLGISLMRISGEKKYGAMSMPNMLPAVLPCEDILEVARQVPAAGKDKKNGAPPQ